MITKDFIPLSDDLLFKEIFAHQDNREQLIYFLKTTTGFDEHIIRNHLVVHYESVFEKSKLKEKAMRGDIVIHFDHYIVNLECYSSFNSESFDKSMSYVMRIFSTQLDKGESYGKLRSVIQINLIDGVDTDFDSKVISSYHIINDDNINDKKNADKFMMKYYRLDKARLIPYNELDGEMRWIRFIGAQSEEERKEIAKGDELLMDLDNWIDNYIMDENTKKYYGEWAEQIALRKGEKTGI